MWYNQVSQFGVLWSLRLSSDLRNVVCGVHRSCSRGVESTGESPRSFQAERDEIRVRGQLCGRVGPTPLNDQTGSGQLSLKISRRLSDILEERGCCVGKRKPETRRDVWGAKGWRPRKGDTCLIRSTSDPVHLHGHSPPICPARVTWYVLPFSYSQWYLTRLSRTPITRNL